MATIPESVEVKLEVDTAEAEAKLSRLARFRSGWASTKLHLVLIFGVLLTGAWLTLAEPSRADTFLHLAGALCALAGTQIVTRTAESVMHRKDQQPPQ